MMDMNVFWILVGAIAVAIEIIDRLRYNRET